MERQFEVALEEFRREHKRAANEALHVGGAAAMKPALLHGEAKRIAIPRLPVHRHDIGMPREDNAAATAMAERCEEIRFAPVVVGGHANVGGIRPQLLAHEVDQVQIGVAADGRESDQFADHFNDRRRRRRIHNVLAKSAE